MPQFSKRKDQPLVIQAHRDCAQITITTARVECRGLN
jgi:hypothetical protein